MKDARQSRNWAGSSRLGALGISLAIRHHRIVARQIVLAVRLRIAAVAAALERRDKALHRVGEHAKHFMRVGRMQGTQTAEGLPSSGAPVKAEPATLLVNPTDDFSASGHFTLKQHCASAKLTARSPFKFDGIQIWASFDTSQGPTIEVR